MKNRLPLEGVTVLELGNSVAAPFAGEILGDLGADVIKVEKRDGGDDARKWAPPYWHGTSAIFQNFNRNKRSVVVELRDPAENARLKAFILERVDVVLQNMRPGLVEELGLDGPTLRHDKPELIYATIGAFGSAGPYKDRPGYDPLMQAFGGLMSITGEEGRPPVRVAPAIIDQGSAMWMVIGILSALHRRAATGTGGVIDCSLYETALFWMGVPTATYLASKQVPHRMGTENGNLAPYKAFEASDGWAVICAGNDQQFARLAAALGHPEWASDPQLRTNPDRVLNRERINALVADVVKGASRDHWQSVLDAAGVPCAPMLSLDEVLAHPQCRAIGMLQEAPDGGIPLMGVPLSFDGERPPYRTSPPALGEATDLVLKHIREQAAE